MSGYQILTAATSSQKAINARKLKAKTTPAT